MDVRTGVFILFMLGFNCANGARELVAYKTEKTQVKASEEVGKNQLCMMCEEFATDTVNYFSDNKTQTEIMKILHKSCSKMLFFKQECITLVDYYVPLFFLEIATIRPGDFCQKFGLCKQVIAISPNISKNSCELCHHAVSKALIKLKDPDTQCKKLVFEYASPILVNAEEFLETNDICTIWHSCDSPSTRTVQPLPQPGKSLVSDS